MPEGNRPRLRSLLQQHFSYHAKLWQTVPENLARRHKVIPLQKEGQTLTVAMARPVNVVALDDLRLATGCDIVPLLVEPEEMDEFMDQFYHGKAAQQKPEDTPVTNLVDKLLSGAVENRASDVHLEPGEDGLRVRYRIDGMLRDAIHLPPAYRAVVLSRIKILADLDIAEKRMPQEGRARIQAGGQDIDLRVATMPTVCGEKAVIRILAKNAGLYDLPALGFENGNYTRFCNLLSTSYGMVLVTGPTGSGKTTTLYAALQKLNHPQKNILTIEDPVEYILPGINQTQINTKAGLTFAAGLRSMLRQDPDIIMVGEVRDAETAKTAVRAAATGHLVLTTLHTTDTAGALIRLIDMGIESYLVSSSVLGVVAQRLVRKVCPHCIRGYPLSTRVLEYDFVREHTGQEGDVEVYEGRGCEHCGGTGYRGRTSIQEVLPVTEKIRACIVPEPDAGEVRRIARSEGMTTLRQDGVRKVMRGVTTISEVMRVTLDYAGRSAGERS